MGLYAIMKNKKEMKKVYLKIDNISIKRDFDKFGISPISNNSSEPISTKTHKINIHYTLHNSRNDESFLNGALMLEYDLNSKQNILQYAYQQIKKNDKILSDYEDIIE